VNLWPFSKKTKTVGTDRFDLPPGVKLADPSESDTFSNPAEASLQVGMPRGEAPDIAPQPSGLPPQPAVPLPSEGTWESLPVSAEELLRTGPAPRSTTSSQVPPIVSQAPPHPHPPLSPDVSIPGVDFSQALLLNQAGDQAGTSGIPSMESLFPTVTSQSSPQAQPTGTFEEAFQLPQPDMSVDSSASITFSLPPVEATSPNAPVDLMNWEQPQQEPSHASAWEAPQNPMTDTVNTENSIQNLRQKLNGPDAITAPQAHLPVQEPVMQASSGLSALENLKQQAIQESAPSWLHDPVSMTDSAPSVPMADPQTPSTMATPATPDFGMGVQPSQWGESEASKDLIAPALNSQMSFEPATDWAMPADSTATDPFAWNAPSPVENTTTPAPGDALPESFATDTFGLPNDDTGEPLAPPDWSDASATGDSFWSSSLVGTSTGESPATPISQQPDNQSAIAPSPSLPASPQQAAQPESPTLHPGDAEPFRLPGPEATSETAFETPTPASQWDVPLPVIETPAFMQEWGHPDPAPSVEATQFSLPDPLTDGLSMNAQEAQPYLHPGADAPMDFLYGDDDFNTSGDFDEPGTFAASLDTSDESEVGVYSFGADDEEAPDNDLAPPAFSLGMDEADDASIDEDAPPIAADFEAYDMGHYEDPDDPAPAFVLDDSLVSDTTLAFETPEDDIYSLLDDAELAPPEPLPSASQTIVPFPTPHAEPDEALSADFPFGGLASDDRHALESLGIPDTDTFEVAPLMASSPPHRETPDAGTTTDPHRIVAESPSIESRMPAPTTATTHEPIAHKPAETEPLPSSQQARPTTPMMLKPVPLDRTIFQPTKKPLKPFDPNLCERPTPYTEKLAESLHDFEKQILLEDTRFLKQSINNLVDRYFSQQEPEGGW
jgi:hypothetical protein